MELNKLHVSAFVAIIRLTKHWYQLRYNKGRNKAEINGSLGRVDLDGSTADYSVLCISIYRCLLISFCSSVHGL